MIWDDIGIAAENGTIIVFVIYPLIILVMWVKKHVIETTHDWEW